VNAPALTARGFGLAWLMGRMLAARAEELGFLDE